MAHIYTHIHIHIFPHKMSRPKHIYRNITKYNANKTAYKCQIELYSVIPNFISRTIRHVLQENTFYGHNLKVLHKIITKEGCKRKELRIVHIHNSNDTEKVLFMTYSCSLYCMSTSVFPVCSLK